MRGLGAPDCLRRKSVRDQLFDPVDVQRRGQDVTGVSGLVLHPGVFVREEILDELDLSVSKAADILGVRRATLSDLTNGKAAMSPEMALRIEKAFGVSMDTLLRMQALFDSHEMRERSSSIAVERYVPDGPSQR